MLSSASITTNTTPAAAGVEDPSAKRSESTGDTDSQVISKLTNVDVRHHLALCKTS